MRKHAADKALGSATSAAFGPLYLLRGNGIQKRKEASDLIAKHHAAITRYLSEQLARASSLQATMQERRVEAQQVRHQKLADGARSLQRTPQSDTAATTALRGSVGALASDSAQELTSEQVHVFEEEASALLQSLQSDLRAIQTTEKQLHEISELQTQIVQHLQEQNEHTHQLQSDAAGHGEQVTSANLQLRKAKERSHEANRYLSLFFVLSGLVLLVMHRT